MKITFILHHADMAGGIRVVAIYAQRLQQRGHEVLVVSSPWPDRRPIDQLRSLLRGNGWPRSQPIRPSHLDGIGVPHHILDRPRPVVDSDLPDADVVIATWWQTAAQVAALSPAKGKKAFFIQHYETWGGPDAARGVDEAWRLPMKKIVISRWLLDLARTKFADVEAFHVPNSVDLDQFHAPPRDRQPVPTVGMLYSPIPFKGCDVSLEALRRVSERMGKIHLVSFGFKPPTRNLPLPPGTDYTLQPPQDRIRDLYARCDVWLCGSRSEGFHLPPLEAMACRCPVVSTRVGGPLDVIEDGKNGFLVDVEDSAALADRLQKVLQLSPPDWRNMSDSAHATATRYTWSDATDRLEAALHEIAKESLQIE